MNFVKVGLISLALFCVMNIQAQWKPITSSNPENAKLSLVSSDNQSTIISVSLTGFFSNSVETPKGKSQIISLLNGTPIQKSGAPDLPKITTSLIIPDLNSMSIEVLSADFTEYQKVDIAPSKGNLLRTVDPKTVKYIYGEEYLQNSFFPADLAELRSPYILRDFRGQTLIINPIQYNPSSRILKVYNRMVIKVYKTNQKGENEYARTNKMEISNEFNEIYKHQFINYAPAKYTPVNEGTNMLILCHNSYLAAMQPFVDWKNTIGIKTEIVDIATVGTTPSAIKNYLINYCNVKNLNYLLLVGDAAHIPPYNSSSGDSDNSYSYIFGNDHYPDFFVGRFSAETVAHVQTQVTKAINYEKAILADGNWLEKGVTIGSSQGPGDDNEYDYQHQRNIRTDFLGYNYTAVSELYDGNQGGVDATGNPTAAMVSTELNDGRGVITYTGHGSDNSFVTTGFSNTNINNLTNENKLPFIWSVACVNGNFVGQTCFAEAWLRAAKNGNPTGAVATLMSTINQSWNPPMCGQDEMVDIFVESYTANIKRTFGGISMNGCMKMNDEYGTDGDEMTDTWNLFGDPSLMVRSKVPTQMVVSHAPTILLGSNLFTINCDEENAYVSLTINNQIIGTSTVLGGMATINFSPLTNIDTIDVAITAYNKIPYLSKVSIIPPVGPYIILNNFSIDDASGNNNGLANNNETFSLNVTLENVGISPSDSVYATISSTNPNIIINNNNQVWGDIIDGTTSILNNAFNLTLVDGVTDYLVIPICMQIADKNGNNWTSTINLRANAPAFSIGDFIIDDASGNNNGIIDPGETIDLIVSNTNIGHAMADACIGEISCSNPYITINTATANMGSLSISGTTNAVLNISAAVNTPVGTSATISYTITSGLYSQTKSVDIIIGLIPDFIMNNGTVSACVGTFMDHNGNADYTANQNYTMTFLPNSPNSILQFNFTSFSTEANYDYLYIYNGNSTASPQIAGSPFHGTTNPGLIIATNPQGALTFKFTSDGYVNASGWVASFTCVDISNPPTCATNPVPADNNNNFNPHNLLSWDAVIGATSYDVYLGTSLPLTLIQTISTNSCNAILAPNTLYYWQVIPKNDIGNATTCDIWSFTTSDAPMIINMTNGDYTVENALFYDSGGLSNNYQDNENYTITFLPPSRSGKIKVNFNAFNIENGYDYLYVFDGPDALSTQFDNSPYSGTTLPGSSGEIIATNPDGALTFTFTSDYMVNKSGWAAAVSVVQSTVDVKENLGLKNTKDLQIFPIPAKDVINIYSNKDLTNTRLELSTIQGTIVKSTNINTKNNNLYLLNIGDLPKGIYFIRLSNSEENLTKKIIIE